MLSVRDFWLAPSRPVPLRFASSVDPLECMRPLCLHTPVIDVVYAREQLILMGVQGRYVETTKQDVLSWQNCGMNSSECQ
jgi:hypothetical protein